MKKNFILALAVCCTISTVSAQTCIPEDFSGSPAGWTFSQGAKIGDYNSPLNNCSENRGIITPGVGGNNPCNIKTPTYTSTGGSIIQFTFDMLVFDANLKCNTWKNFDCETSIDVFYFVGSTKYTGITDLVLPPNGPLGTTSINFIMPVGGNLTAGTQYAIQFEFKPKSGTGTCVQQNTKYVLDNLRICAGGNTFAGTGNTGTTASDLTIAINPANDLNELKITTTADYDGIELLDNSGKVVRTFSRNKYGVITAPGADKGTHFIRLTKNGLPVTKSIEIKY
jgi:hypothetical protein